MTLCTPLSWHECTPLSWHECTPLSWHECTPLSWHECTPLSCTNCTPLNPMHSPLPYTLLPWMHTPLLHQLHTPLPYALPFTLYTPLRPQTSDLWPVACPLSSVSESQKIDLRWRQKTTKNDKKILVTKTCPFFCRVWTKKKPKLKK